LLIEIFIIEKLIKMKELIKTDFFRLMIEYLQKDELIIDLKINYSLFEEQLMNLINNRTDRLSLYRTLNYTLRELKVLHSKILPLDAGKKRICL